MTTRGRTRLKIWLVVLGVFVLGGLTGVAADSAYRLRANGIGVAWIHWPRPRGLPHDPADTAGAFLEPPQERPHVEPEDSPARTAAAGLASVR